MRVTYRNPYWKPKRGPVDSSVQNMAAAMCTDPDGNFSTAQTAEAFGALVQMLADKGLLTASELRTLNNTPGFDVDD